MVKQKLISLKIDKDLLADLDASLDMFGSKRNSLINDFIRIGLLNLSQFELVKLLADHYDLYKPRYVNGMIVY